MITLHKKFTTSFWLLHLENTTLSYSTIPINDTGFLLFRWHFFPFSAIKHDKHASHFPSFSLNVKTFKIIKPHTDCRERHVEMSLFRIWIYVINSSPVFKYHLLKTVMSFVANQYVMLLLWPCHQLAVLDLGP